MRVLQPLPLIALSLNFCFNFVRGQIKLLSPAALVEKALERQQSDTLSGATATFGAPTYGEAFIGQLVYVPSASNYCAPDYGNAVKAFIATSHSDVMSPHLGRIFLVHRGNCTFVRKVTVAQDLGGNAVLFIDAPDSPWSRTQIQQSVILGDDGNGSSVRIPSVMMAKEDGELVLEFLQPSATQQAVLVQLQWALPQQSPVLLDFWMEAGSLTALRFLRQYAYHASHLRQYLRFTPHYHIFSLVHRTTPYDFGTTQTTALGSPTAAALKNLTLCWHNDLTLCTNPSDIATTRVANEEVLEETVRQLCIWETAVAPHLLREDSANEWAPAAWWEYIRRFYDTCCTSSSGVTSPNGFSSSCSYSVMRSIRGIDTAKVEQCTKARAQELLLREQEHHAWGNLAVRINGAKFSGSLDPVLVSRAVCSALSVSPQFCDKLAHSTKQVTKSASSLDFADLEAVRPSGHYFTLALLLVGISSLIIVMYQKFFRKCVRALLRYEVMLEVRSQMRQYQRLEAASVPHKGLTVPLAPSQDEHLTEEQQEQSV